MSRAAWLVVDADDPGLFVEWVGYSGCAWTTKRAKAQVFRTRAEALAVAAEVSDLGGRRMIAVKA